MKPRGRPRKKPTQSEAVKLHPVAWVEESFPQLRLGRRFARLLEDGGGTEALAEALLASAPRPELREALRAAWEAYLAAEPAGLPQ